MEDRPHPRDGQVGLEVGLVVPQEGAHPVAVADPDRPRALASRSARSATSVNEASIDLAGRAGDGDHLAVAVDLLAVAENPTHQQRSILHGAEHDRSSPVRDAGTSG